MAHVLRRISNIRQHAVDIINRNLSLQEHVAHALLNEHGIVTPKFGVAKSSCEAEKIAKDLLTRNLMVKAQVLTAGRGKGKFKNGFKGGIHSATQTDEVKEIAAMMIAQKLVTEQTGPQGRICNSVMVTERKFARREFCFAIKMERTFNSPVLIASRRGGANFGDAATDSPHLIIYEKIDVERGLTMQQAEATCKKIGFCDQPAATIKMLMSLYQLFVEKDALLVEINPYIEDVCLNYYTLDVKMEFDDSAKFRQKELFEKRDLSQEDPKEAAAADLDMNYIAMDGSIGCLVNGAGLAMATMDIIKFHGGDPANFLDVGDMAIPENITEAFKIITMDPKVKTIFVNIFGGIMKCDITVEGIVKAIKELNLKIPIVVRLQDTDHDQANKIIIDSKLNIIMRENFDDAAKTSVRCARIMDISERGHLDANLSMKIECDCISFPQKKPTTSSIVVIK